MAWIDYIDPANATGDLKIVYEELPYKSENIPEIEKVQSHNPEAFKQRNRLNQALFFGDSNLTQSQRQMIHTAVSTANNCDY